MGRNRDEAIAEGYRQAEADNERDKALRALVAANPARYPKLAARGIRVQDIKAADVLASRSSDGPDDFTTLDLLEEDAR